MDTYRGVEVKLSVMYISVLVSSTLLPFYPGTHEKGDGQLVAGHRLFREQQNLRILI
jgi:hypothetical protein